MSSNKNRMRKKAILHQVAALPYRVDEQGATEILLITSRDTKRYIIPKGWRMKGRSDAEAAAQEAEEEAGILGKISTGPIGTYSYRKQLPAMSVEIKVSVYLLAVVEQLLQWREQDERSRIWVKPDRAAVMVSDRGLVPFVLGLDEPTTYRDQIQAN